MFNYSDVTEYMNERISNDSYNYIECFFFVKIFTEEIYI